MVSILLGPGNRLELVGAVLHVLAARNAASGRVEAADVVELSDLEELLVERSPLGRLLLDVDLLPPEDVGFVRRFAERHPRWQVVLVGIDPYRPGARGLLGDPRVAWLRWSPDLEALAALLEPVQEPSDALQNGYDAERLPARRADRDSVHESVRRLDVALASLRNALDRDEDPEPAARAAGDAARVLDGLVHSPAPSQEVFDLHRLVEELLAESVLGGAPRYRFRSQGDLHLCADRSELKDSLGSLLWIAARCGDEGSVIELRADGGTNLGAAVQLALDFPAGPLEGLDGREALGSEALGQRISSEAAERGARAARSLRTLGARLRTASTYPGRMRVELALPRTPADPAPEFPLAPSPRTLVAGEPFEP